MKTTVQLETKDVREIIAKFLGIPIEKALRLSGATLSAVVLLYHKNKHISI